jgi:hypothetical protein
LNIKDVTVVDTVLLTTCADGAHRLGITSKSGQMDLEFSPALWAKLADSARWFQGHANGISLVTVEQLSEQMSEEE